MIVCKYSYNGVDVFLSNSFLLLTFVLQRSLLAIEWFYFKTCQLISEDGHHDILPSNCGTDLWNVAVVLTI